MKIRGARLRGVSRVTGLPRYVIRIVAAGKTYHYFRHGPIRVALPDPSSPQFAGTYAALLLEHGLAAAAKGAPPLRTFKEPEVYFIQDGHSGAIKIGTALYPAQRMRELQVGATGALALLCSVPGGRELERSLHERLAQYRIRGEWFLNHPEVQKIIREIRR